MNFVFTSTCCMQFMFSLHKILSQLAMQVAIYATELFISRCKANLLFNNFSAFNKTWHPARALGGNLSRLPSWNSCSSIVIKKIGFQLLKLLFTLLSDGCCTRTATSNLIESPSTCKQMLQFYHNVFVTISYLSGYIWKQSGYHNYSCRNIFFQQYFNRFKYDPLCFFFLSNDVGIALCHGPSTGSVVIDWSTYRIGLKTSYRNKCYVNRDQA